MARRLLLILLVPLLGFGAVLAWLYQDRGAERGRHDDAGDALVHVEIAGEVIDALDAELRRSLATDITADQLAAARTVTDAALAELATVPDAPAVFEAVAVIAATIDARDATGPVASAPLPTIDRYVAAIDAADRAMADLASNEALDGVTAEVIAHQALRRARTAALIEQVQIGQVLGTGEWVEGQYAVVIAAVADEGTELAFVENLAVEVTAEALVAPEPLRQGRAQLAEKGEEGLVNVAIADWQALSDGWRTQLTTLADGQLVAAEQSLTDAAADATGARRAILLLGGLVALLSVGAAVGAMIMHDRRVQHLRRHMVEVAEGNLDLEPIADSRRDELGVIADAFDGLTEAVRRSVASDEAEAAILTHIARGSELGPILDRIAALATNQTGVEHRITAEDPGTNSAEPIRASDGDVPVAWLVRVGAEPLTGPRPPVVSRCIGLALLAFERDRTDQALTYQATHDVLTGLANRSVLLREAARALTRTTPGRTAVLYCDLDGFKAVNDSHGHRAGDRLLVETATRLRTVIGSSGLLARVGGDEFVALLPEVSAVETVTAVADSIIEAVSAPFQQGQLSLVISVSVGIAFASPGASAEDMVRSADLALYQAKAAGRSRWELFDEELGESAAKRVETANALRTALDEEQIELWYQPVFGIAGGLVGFEGLVRWNRPGYGIVSPADFLSVAEETGMIIPLGERVVRDGCRQLAVWTAAVPDVPTVLSLNMSGAQLTHTDFADRVGEALREAAAPANRLQVEITETVLLENRVEATSALAGLRRMGVRIAIDDFGTGYSSLAFLRELPIDLLKIDRAFIRQIEESAEDQAIVRAVISLADALRMVVIAEGVERPEQLRELKQLGCRYVQGFLMGRPMTAFAATKLLEDQLAANQAAGISAST